MGSHRRNDRRRLRGRVEEAQLVRDYNYEHFDDYVSSGAADTEFPAFRNHLHVGDRAPDFTAARLDAEESVAVSDLWRSQPVVMEFGSFT